MVFQTTDSIIQAMIDYERIMIYDLTYLHMWCQIII